MCGLIFQVNKQETSRSYRVFSKSFSRDIPEVEAVELMVSIIRAQAEVTYIIQEKPKVYSSTNWLPLLVMAKKESDLKVELLKDRIRILIFDSIIEYDVESFRGFSEEIYQILNKEYGHNMLDFKSFSPIYLEHMLGVDIPRIERIEFGYKNISDLYFYNRTEPQKAKIYEHDLYKQLRSGNFDSGRSETNHLFESNEERLRRILAEISVQKNGFYIILYGNEEMVRDGTHRLACLYYLYGDMEVPVIRLYVSHPYYSYTMYRAFMHNIEMEVIR